MPEVVKSTVVGRSGAYNPKKRGGTRGLKGAQLAWYRAEVRRQEDAKYPITFVQENPKKATSASHPRYEKIQIGENA